MPVLPSLPLLIAIFLMMFRQVHPKNSIVSLEISNRSHWYYEELVYFNRIYFIFFSSKFVKKIRRSQKRREIINKTHFIENWACYCRFLTIYYNSESSPADFILLTFIWIWLRSGETDLWWLSRGSGGMMLWERAGLSALILVKTGIVFTKASRSKCCLDISVRKSVLHWLRQYSSITLSSKLANSLSLFSILRTCCFNLPFSAVSPAISFSYCYNLPPKCWQVFCISCSITPTQFCISLQTSLSTSSQISNFCHSHSKSRYSSFWSYTRYRSSLGPLPRERRLKMLFIIISLDVVLRF